MNEVYIVDGLRSHIGLKNGIFKNILPENIGAEVLKEIIKRNSLLYVDEVICGNAAGPGGNIGRLMSLYAGLDEETVSYSIDMQCGSALKCIDIGFAKIASGQADIIIAGGTESSSCAPHRFYNENDWRYSREENNEFTSAQFSPQEKGGTVMLQGAERTAHKGNMTRAELDFWPMVSHKRAAEARKNHLLDDCILSINDSTADEGIRENMSEKLLSRLKGVVNRDGLVTAGNACLINDGAAFVILCSKKFLEENNLQAKAKIIKTCFVGSNPLLSPMSAIKACDKLLERCSLSYEDISAFEFNEAFAVIDVMFQRKNPHLIDRYNIFGGALAYGHPYGASGAIIMTHLMKALEQVNGKYGICSIAAAGGIGSAILIERVI